jgi:hypothetical protein
MVSSQIFGIEQLDNGSPKPGFASTGPLRWRVDSDL